MTINRLFPFCHRFASIGSSAVFCLCLPLTVLFAFCLAAQAQSGFTSAQRVLGSGFSTSSGIGGTAVDRYGNVFVADPGNNAIKEVVAAGGYTTVNLLGSGFSAPKGVAVDSIGNVFVADTSNGAVKEILAAGGYTTVNTLASGFSSPAGVAVDASGNVFVADSGNSKVKEILAVGGSIPANPTINTLGSGFSIPTGVAVDGSGNVFVADSGLNAVEKIVAVGGSIPSSPQINPLATSFNQPWGVALDGSGNVFVTEYAGGTLKAILAAGGYTTVKTLTTGLTSPMGVAVDASGNAYTNSTGTLWQFIFSSSVNFVSQAVGSTSTTVLMNFTIPAGMTIGSSAVLTLGNKNLDFTDAGSSTCVAATYSTTTNCVASVHFTPVAPGLRRGALAIFDASGNQIGSWRFYGVGLGPQLAFAATQMTLPITNSPDMTNAMRIQADAKGNLYAAIWGDSASDPNSGSVMKFNNNGSGYSTGVTIASGLSQPVDLAIDGAGNVFVLSLADSSNDPNSGALLAILKTTTGYALPFTVESGLNSPWGLAIDPNQDVFVATPSDGRITEFPVTGSGLGSPVTVASGLSSVMGLALDSNGNLFAVRYHDPAKDPNSGSLLVLPKTTSGYGSPITLTTGLSFPAGLAVDTNGNVLVASTMDSNGDLKSGALLEIPFTGTAFGAPVTLATGMTFSQGVALDASGNIFTLDQTANLVVVVPRATPPTVTFASTVAGATSSDSPKTITVENIGNRTLNFISLFYPPSFPEDASGTADCAGANPLPANGACTLTVDFKPNAAIPYSESLGLMDNTLNGTSVPQSITLNGAGLTVATTTTLASSLNPSSYGQLVTITATVTPASGAALPTGTVQFSVDGSAAGSPLALSSGIATYTTSALSAGTHGITALYTPPTGSGFISSSSKPLSQVVAAIDYSAPTEAVGTPSAIQTATILLSSSFTLGSISVVTQGATGLDFKVASGGTCAIGASYTAGQTCTVNYTFTPTAPGTRMGAIVLFDNTTPTPVAQSTTYLQGTGMGPQVAFSPGAQTTVDSRYGTIGASVDANGNLYIADYNGGQVVKVMRSGSGYGAPTTIASGLNYPSGVAVDGSGSVYIADSYNLRVVKLPWTGSGYGTLTTVAGGLGYPWNVAVDGSGNVYIADTTNHRVVKVPWTGSGYGTQTTVGSGLGATWGVAVDGSGNVYIADPNNSRVVKVPWMGSGYGTQTTVGSGLSNPYVVAVDGSGNVYVADTGAGNVVKVAWTGSDYGTPTPVGSGWKNPYGVAVDGGGNVYVADKGLYRLVKVDVADPPSLSFASTPISATSSDSPQTVTLWNIGNAALTLPVPSTGNNPAISANFTLNSTGTSACPLIASTAGAPGTLAQGSSCTLPITFAPRTAGTLTGLLVLTDNTLNLASQTQTIQLGGTATQLATTLSLAASPSTLSTVDTPVTFTATVTPNPAPAPANETALSGTVAFYQDGSSTPMSGCGVLSYNTTTGQATASCTTATLTSSGSPHAIRARYSGDANYTGSDNTATPLMQIVNKANTTTTVASTPNYSSPWTVDQPVTLTATVSPSPGTAFVAYSGTVTFSDYAGSITGCSSPVAVNATTGTASCTATALTAGSHNITATFAGDSNYNGSVSSTLSTTVNPASTTTTLNSSANPSSVNQSVIFTATVVPSSGTVGVPFTGTMNFTDNGKSIASCSAAPVNGTTGVAICTTSALAAMYHSVVATFVGDANYTQSTSSTTPQQVNSLAATLGMIASPASPSSVNQQVTFTAQLVGVAVTPVVPTGTVSFKINGKSNADCPDKQVDGSGKTTCTTSSLAAGGNSISATYSGDTNFTVASAGTATQTVTALTATLGVTASPSSSTSVNTAVTFTAQLAGAALTPVVPSGTVAFTAKGAAISGCSAVTVNSTGKATCTTSSLAVGSNPITATYSGDTNFIVTSAGTATQTVSALAATLGVTASPSSPTNINDAVTFTAQLAGVALTPIAPSGTVSFTINGSPSPDCPDKAVDATGKATCKTSSLPAGGNTILASYKGDTNFTVATPGTATQTVTALPATLGVTASPSSSTHVNDSVTLTAQLGGASFTPVTPSGKVHFSANMNIIAACTAVPVDATGKAVCTVSSLAEGTDAISASYSGDTSFTVAVPATATQTVSPLTPTLGVTASPSASTSVDQQVTFTAQLSGVSFTPITPSGTVNFTANGTTITGCGSVTVNASGTASCSTASLAAGPYSIAAVYSGDINFTVTTPGAASHTVTALVATLGLTAAPSSSTHFNDAVTFTAQLGGVTLAPVAPSGRVSFTANATTITGCGSVLVDSTGKATCTTSTLAPGSDSIAAAYAGDVSYVVTAPATATQTVTATTTTAAANASLTYSASTQNVSLSATVTGSSGTVNVGTVTFTVLSGATVIGSPVTSSTVTGGAAGVIYPVPAALASGSYAIQAVYNAAGYFATSNDASHTLSIQAAMPNIAWTTPSPITYGTALSSAQLNATTTPTVAGTFAYTPASGTVPSSGTQTLSVTFTPTDNTDYLTATQTVSLVVNKATLTVTASSPTVAYGAAVPTITPSYSGYQNGDTASVVTVAPACTTNYTTTTKVNATPPTTSCSGGTVSSNYNFSYVSGTVTVTQAASTITWATPAAINYGTALSATQLNASLNAPGSCVYSPGSGVVLPAGSQTLTANCTPTDTTDYSTPSASTVLLTVNKAALSVTADNQSMNYGGTVPTLTGTLSGVVAGDGITASYSTTGTSTSAPGPYPITAALNDPNSKLSNYAVTNTSGTLTIAKATATVTLASLTQTYSGSALAATYTTSPAGLNVILTYNGSSNAPAAAGTYSVVGTIEDNNYAGTATGTLTINQAAQSITFAPLASPVTYVSPIPLIATGGASGNPVIFSVVSGPGSISGNLLTITRVGTVVVAANQAGNANYLAAAQVTHSVVAVASNPNLNLAGMAFGSVPLGSTSPAQTLIIANTNGFAMTNASIVASGDFTAVSNCPVIAPLGACSVNVTFTPTATGLRTGALTVTDAQTGTPQSVPLTGTGTAPGIQITPASLNFGSEVVATASYGQTITIQNTGTANLIISNIATTGDFTTTGNCATVPAGSNCSLTVTFTPTVVGARTGTVTLTDNAGGGSQSQVVNLSGVGTLAGATLTPSVQTFSGTLVGSSSFVLSATLTNTGTAPLTGIAVAILGDFSQTNTCGATLAPAATCTLSVTYTPTVAGAESGTLTVTDSLGTQTVSLVGTGLTPGASLSTAQLTFGGQLVNTSSLAQTVIFTNSGSGAVNIASVVPSANFTDTTNCSGSIPAGASCSINVIFTPAVTGPLSGAITITDDAGTQVATLQGQGVSKGLAVSPSFEIFGAQQLGTTSQAQTLVVTNTGTVALTLNPITLSNNFTESDQCSSVTLQAGASCSISLSFSPTATGMLSGSLVVSDTTGLVSTMATATGQGTLPGIATSPSMLSFGSLAVGTTSQAQTVTVSNTGKAPLQIGTVSGTGDFAETDTCSSQTIAAGSYCVISVTMTPTTVGMRTGSIQFNDNADGLHLIALSGMGQQAGVSVSPTGLAFGSLPFVSTSQVSAATGTSLSVTITNTGTVALQLNGFSTQGDFTESDSCGATIAVGASCTLTVKFVPTALGHRTGTLTISDNAGGSTQLVSLEGDGSPAGLFLTPPVLNFGVQSVGVTSNPETATLTNNTGQSIPNLAITASGEYNESDNCGTVLGNGASCTLTITVTPATAGAITGTVNISAGATIVTGSQLAKLRREAAANSSNSSVGVVAVTATTNRNASATVSQLLFATLPAPTVTAGGNAGSSITVAENDSTGTLVNATDTITLTVTGPGSYSQTYTAAAAGGVANFNLSSYPLTVAGSYTYTVAVAANASIRSAVASQTVNPGAAASVSATAGSGQSAVINAAFATALQVTVKDAYSNPVSGATVTFTVPATGASASLSSLSATTGSIGTASVTATANGSAGAYTVTAAVSGATSASFSLTNAKATPTITWATPAAITYGTALSATQLNATSTVAGSLAYTPASGTVLSAGSQTLQTVFTPTDTADYATATASVTLVVNKATPTITWATPAAITFGTALSATQLNATALVPGTFAYTPAAGATPALGSDTLSVTFTPTDATDYTTATASVTLVVNPVPSNPVPVLSSMSPAFTSAGGAAFTLTLTGTGFISSSKAYWGSTALTTTYVSATQLTAQVTAASIATTGATAVTVQTPTPGGGTSNTMQFEVDTTGSTSTPPTFTTVTATVTAGSTASYPVTLPATVTSATVTCLNLPTGATCSYSSTTNALTITTASTTPAGTYQITVVFTETVTGAAASWILLPILLLPLFMLRRKLAARGIWLTASLGVVLLAAAAFSTGCGGGGSTTTTTPQTHQATSSGSVTLIIH